MIAAYGTAVVLVVASVCLGGAVCSATGSVRSAAPAVGLAVLILICSLFVRLPGGTTTAVVCAGLACLAAAAVWLRRRPPVRAAAAPLAAGSAAAAVSALPFIAHERVGILGMSLNNDTAVHLLWAEGLRSEAMARLYELSEGYPIGPHTVMATLSTGLGVSMDAVMTGLLIAVVIITAIAALDLLHAVPAVPRVLLAALASSAYLVAAYYGQGAFKELIQSLFLLAFVVQARDLQRRPREQWVRAVIPLGLLLAACVATYSYLGAAWFVAFLGSWAVLLVVVHRPGLGHVAGAARALVAPVLVGTAVTVAAIAPQADRALAYLRQIAGSATSGAIGIPASDLGNLAGPLSPFQALGIWRTADFRFAPVGGVGLEQYLALGLALLAGALWLRRRETALPAAVLGSAAIYFASSKGQSPYAVAKALAIPAPLVVVLIGGALLAARRETRLPRSLFAAGWVAGAIFVVLAGSSTTLALRYSPVAPSAQSDQLSSLRGLLRGTDTLFLGSDDYAGWRLRGVRLGQISTSGFPPPSAIAAHPEKPHEYGQPLDFDSVTAQDLDRFRYVVLPRTGYRSAPPANFRRVRATALFEVWERRGRTPESSSLEPGGAPGVVLDCREDPDARRLSRRRGTAQIMQPPPVVGGPLAALTPGASQQLALELAPGDWSLSLQYVSPVPVRIHAGQKRWTLPPNLGRPGPFFAFGRLRVGASGGPTGFVVIAERVSRLASPSEAASISALAATSSDGRRVVSLPRACGRYVDRYQTATAP